MLDRLIKIYNEAIFDTDREKALQIIQNALNEGLSAEDILFHLVVPAMESMITSISETMDANLAQHFMTAQISSEVTEAMLARFQTPPEPVGHIVIGTAHGDMHSLGKRIVIGCLKARLIEATDLGVNVSPERFVDEAVARHAQVIGISAMMVHTARGANGCLRVRQILKERGLEKQIKIIVGGAPYRFDSELYKTVQADAWAEDGITASRIITDMIKEAKL
jgi:methanogenic corrinoid protein MtbC1